MKPRVLTVMALITAGAVALAALAVHRQRERLAARADTPLLFSDLAQRINDIAEVRVLYPGGQTATATRTPQDADGWVLLEKGRFPASFETVKKTVMAAAGLRLLEPRTSNPDLYHRLGVQDPSTADLDPDGQAARPVLLTLLDGSGQQLASVIIGNDETRGGFGFNQPDPGIYIRRDGEAQSWLARSTGGRLEIPSEPLQWVDRQVINIGRDRVQSITAHHPDPDSPGGQTLFVYRDSPEDANFAVAEVPEGRELTYPTSANPIGNALASVYAEDIRPASEVDFDAADAPPATTEFRTFDGLVIAVQVLKIGERNWARFAARASPAEASQAPPTGTPDQVQAQSTEINTRLAPFAIAISDYAAKNLAPRMADLLKPLGTPDAPATGPIGPTLPPPSPDRG